MASIADSVKLIYTDENAFVKLAVVSIIPFAVYSVTRGYFSFSKSLDLYLCGFLAIYYLGYMFRVLTNSIQEKDYILPKIRPFSTFFSGLKPILGCGAFLFPIYLFYAQVVPMIDTSVIGGKILVIIGYLITASFFFSSIIIYAPQERIIDGFNIVRILKIFHEVIVYLVYSAILLVIFNLITSAPLLAAIYGLFGFGHLFDYIVCFLVTSNLAIYFQNLSHLYFEVVR